MIRIRLIFDVFGDETTGLDMRVGRIAPLVRLLLPVADRPALQIMRRLSVALDHCDIDGYIDSFDGNYHQYRQECESFDDCDFEIICGNNGELWVNEICDGEYDREVCINRDGKIKVY